MKLCQAPRRLFKIAAWAGFCLIAAGNGNDLDQLFSESGLRTGLAFYRTAV